MQLAPPAATCKRRWVTTLRDRRRSAGLTQAQLADRAGVSRRTVATADAGGHISSKVETKLLTALSANGPGLSRADATTPAPEAPAREIIYVADERRGGIKPLRELPTYGQLSWDAVDAIRAALTQHMNGQFQLSAQLLDAMFGDDRITGVFSARLDGLLGLPVEMHPPTGDEETEAALEIASEALEAWPKMAPEASLRELLRWGRGLGVAVWENIPANPGDPWTRKVKVWHPRYLYWVWDINRQPYSGSYKLITADGLLDLSLGDDGLIHSVDGKGAEEVGRFGLYAPFGYQRPWIHGLVRSLAMPWLVRNFTLRDWARYSEIHGIPIRAVTMPVEWEPAERSRAEAEIAALGSESVVKLLEDKDGRGFKLSLIEPKAQSEKAFEGLIAKCDTAIAVAILGQNLTTEIGGSSGSRAAAQVHDRVRDDIIRSDAETLSTALHDQVLVQWSEFHHGTSDLAPWPKWMVEQPEDETARATALSQTASAIGALRSSQLPVDWALLCEQHGIPLQEGVEIDDFEPPPPPMLPGQAPPDEEDPEEDPALEDKPEDDAKTKDAKAELRAARRGVMLNRATLAAGRLSRRTRAPVQGQAYVDDLAAAGAGEAARVLAGDVRAIKAILSNAKPTKDGKIDGDAIKKALVAAFSNMQPDALAKAIKRCQILANLSGRYAVTKEVLSD